MSEVPQSVMQRAFGAPEKVLAIEDLPVAAPGPREVTIALRMACLNPSDFGLIAGTYGKRLELPAVVGREGWGEVTAVGADVSRWRRGDRVRMPEASGVLRQAVTVPEDDLLPIPAELDPAQAAMAFINPPTAWRLLEDFVDLQAGDWIVQNAANSAVGVCVCGFARARGIKTLALCRDSAVRRDALIRAGATAVAEDDDTLTETYASLTDGQRPRLALNSIGGSSVQRLIKMLADGGTCVTFGGMTGEPVRFPTRYLIFNDIRLRGFWMDRWLRTHRGEQTEALMARIYNALERGEIHIPVAKIYAFGDAVEGFAHAAQGGRDGKVIIRSAWSP